MKRALLFGSVPCGDGAFLRPYLDGGGWTVFCADGGVRNARAAGFEHIEIVANDERNNHRNVNIQYINYIQGDITNDEAQHKNGRDNQT